MILDRVHIKNFRSIKDETIRFDKNCKILLGRNEAGKSNVLKSLAAVFDQYTVSAKDRRKRINNEKIEEYFVRAILKLEQEDINATIKNIQEIKNFELIGFSNGKSVADYVKSNFKELLIQIDIENSATPHFSYWKVNANTWKLNNNLFYQNNELNTDGGESFNLNSILFDSVTKRYNENPINCNYWQYKEDFLLPGNVAVSEFLMNPSRQKALENIFILCKREDVKAEFEDALKEDGDYSNLLEQVSKETTKVFHSIWKDFKQTRIELIPNGNDEILIKVVNKTKYSFEDRSDGFKKFISILLMLSTQARSNKFNHRDIILIDEPDQSLYPSSVRYLREELLKIAENAVVMFSTHSPYMIDSICIDRHLVVEKIDDITTIKKQDANAPFSEDELLRNVIGSSIFDCLQPVNIVFEGWLDQQLFEKYCQLSKDKSFEHFGRVFLRGISGLDALIQLLILANKKFLIVADSDKPSKDKRKEFESVYLEHCKNWIAYGDVIPNVSTMEDFLSSSHITATLTNHGVTAYSYDSTMNAIQNIEKAVKNNKEKKQAIKNDLIKDITKTKINREYVTFIQALAEKLKNL